MTKQIDSFTAFIQQLSTLALKGNQVYVLTDRQSALIKVEGGDIIVSIDELDEAGEWAGGVGFLTVSGHLARVYSTVGHVDRATVRYPTYYDQVALGVIVNYIHTSLQDAQLL